MHGLVGKSGGGRQGTAPWQCGDKSQEISARSAPVLSRWSAASWWAPHPTAPLARFALPSRLPCNPPQLRAWREPVLCCPLGAGAGTYGPGSLQVGAAGGGCCVRSGLWGLALVRQMPAALLGKRSPHLRLRPRLQIRNSRTKRGPGGLREARGRGRVDLLGSQDPGDRRRLSPTGRSSTGGRTLRDRAESIHAAANPLTRSSAPTRRPVPVHLGPRAGPQSPRLGRLRAVRGSCLRLAPLAPTRTFVR